MSNGSPFPDDLISAYRDGELSAAEREAVARLLEDSADARTELEDYQALSDLLRGVPGDRAPDGFRAAVMGRIERESLLAPAPAATASRPRLARRFWIIGTALAASAAGLFLVLNVGRDHLPAVGGAAVATNSAPDGPATPPLLPRGSVEDDARIGRSFAREAIEAHEAAWEEAEPVPAIAASEGTSRGFAAGSAGQPPAGAQPGDSYSFAELGADGDVMIVNATVLDLDLGLNQLRYLLAKNSIRPQPVATHDYADLSSVADPAGSEFAVYVVSDPAQINAALEEARQQSDLFLNFKLAGVLNAPAPATVGDAAGVEVLDGAAPEPADSARSETTRDTRSVDELREREPAVAGRARASYPAERFAFDPADRARGGQTGLAVEAPRPAPPSPTALPPAPADLAPRLAESEGGDRGAAYQQLLNVSKAEISLNLQREREKLNRQNSLPAGAEGAAGADGFGAVTDRPEVEFFKTLNQARQPLADSAERDLGSRQQSGKQEQAQQVQKRLRMLLLLEPDAKALKAKADARSLPVEAPRPASKKS